MGLEHRYQDWIVVHKVTNDWNLRWVNWVGFFSVGIESKG